MHNPVVDVVSPQFGKGDACWYSHINYGAQAEAACDNSEGLIENNVKLFSVCTFTPDRSRVFHSAVYCCKSCVLNSKN